VLFVDFYVLIAGFYAFCLLVCLFIYRRFGISGASNSLSEERLDLLERVE
jgi:hypothetical protein